MVHTGSIMLHGGSTCYTLVVQSTDSVLFEFFLYRNYLWPDGVRAKPGPERTEAMQMRTKMAARAKLLGTIPGTLYPCHPVLSGSQTFVYYS